MKKEEQKNVLEMSAHELLEYTRKKFGSTEMPRIEFNKFYVQKVNVSKAQNMTLSFVELRVDDNGIYDINHSQQDWRFRNDLVFELVEQLVEFVPSHEKGISIQEVEFMAQSWVNEDEESFTINFNGIKFKFSHQIGESARKTQAKTEALDINELVSEQEEDSEKRLEKLKTLIERINVNVYEFCILGTTFEPEETDSEDLID